MLEILNVCTGNICRSPIAEQLLKLRLADFPVKLESAGTRAREGMRMTSEAAAIASSIGVPEHMWSAHQAHYLTDQRLQSADLALAMARDHRREIVELNPALLRRTFTIRELHRLVSMLSDDSLKSAADSAPEQTPGQRLGQMLALVASQRGTAPPPRTPDTDDVVDPFGRSMRTYEVSVDQIHEAVPSVERVVRLAVT